LRARGLDAGALILPERHWAADPVGYYGEVAATLRRRELVGAAAQLQQELGLGWKDVGEEGSAQGKLVRRVDLASGRFALLSDSLEFSLVPWRPEMEQRIGRELSVRVRGGDFLRPAGERLEHFETERRRKDGCLVPVSVTASPILDRSGVVRGASIVARDISERLRGEAERAERRGDLEEALRLRFQAGLVDLDSRELIELRPALTNHELLSAVPSPTLAELVEGFEAVAYGGRAADEDDLRSARDGWPRVPAEAGRR
ncbi:MAG: DUF3363 domain-containing protein, partial [Actinobacteria bacterium]|nr:DUF3363 domain-containing protein [Actinomycetota bacterium]